MLHPAAVEFIERLSLLAESAGIPRIGGCILGLLVMEESPLSSDELVSRLQVSKGSVSANIRLLESRGVVRRISHLGDRKDRFEVDASFPERMIERSLAEQRSMRLVAMEARSRLPSRYVRAKDALRRIEAFSTISVESMERMLTKWRESAHEDEAAATVHEDVAVS
ncbi:MAG: MarR family transcriptional regulator [Thermoanaerobaculia bacterium]|jgi:DNA-binding transcriptional regulator GbsR (MarR family)